MGKRSRTKQQEAKEAWRKERTARRQTGWRERIAAASEGAEKAVRARPPAPWDPFPLTELLVFVGIVFMVAGTIMGIATDAGKAAAATGLVSACIGGLDNAIREHIAGYRSHASLLAGFVIAVVVGVTSALRLEVPVRVALGLGLGTIVFFTLRRLYLARSGGKPF